MEALSIYTSPAEDRIRVSYQAAPLKSITVVNFMSSIANYDYNHPEKRDCYVQRSYIKSLQHQGQVERKIAWGLWIASLLVTGISPILGGNPMSFAGLSLLLGGLVFLTLVGDAGRNLLSGPLVKQLKEETPVEKGFPIFDYFKVKVHYSGNLQVTQLPCSTWLLFGFLVLVQMIITIVALILAAAESSG